MVAIIYNILISIFMMVMTLVAIYLPGIVWAHFIIPKQDKKQYFWVLAPFLGISISILVLQSLVYLDVPLSISVFPYFLIIVIAAGYIFSKYKKDMPRPQSTLFLFTVVILLIHGIGFWVLGASNYIGYGWIDQHNYVGISQFLMDKPFSTGLEGAENIPYLVDAILKKNDRIGQSILQGFVAVLSHVNAKTAYGSISLLSPFLTFLSVWMLSLRLTPDKWKQYGVAFAASFIPGFAMIHLENFLSQALAVPFLLLWPLTIENAIRNKGWGNIAIGVFIFAAAHAIYTEFTPFFILLALSALFWSLLQKNKITDTSQAIFLILTVGLLVNVGYLEKSITLMSRGAIPNILQSIYPFSLKVEGLRYLWFGYSEPWLGSDWLIFTVNFVAVLLTLLAFAGLLNNFRKQKDIVSLLILIIVILPIVIISQAKPYPYQFYKMLLTISPLFMMGLWLVMSDFWNDDSKNSPANYTPLESLYKPVRVLPIIILISLLLSSLLVTGYLALLSINGGGRSVVKLVNTKEMLDTYSFLEGEKNKVFIVSVSHPYPLAWVAYHGRNNRIFFINNQIGDVPLDKISTEKFSFNDPSKFPFFAKKLTLSGEYPKIAPLSLSESLIAVIENPQGMEGSPGSEFNWLGKEMTLLLYSQANSEKNITLSFDAIPGLGDPTNQRIIEINVTEGKSQTPVRIKFDSRRTILVPLTIAPGVNIIKFRTIFPEKATVILPQDPREFLVHISQMKILGEDTPE